MMDALALKLCDIQGCLFELSVGEGMDSENFIQVFMNSAVAEGLDSTYNRMQWAGEEYLLEELDATCDIARTENIYARDVMYWIGYQYRYWSILRKISSKKIVKQAPAKTMNRNYLLFHTMDPEMAVEDLEEIYKQKQNGKCAKVVAE